ncbi:MAG: replicative DNA helicase [Eubacteriales bacterium]
MGENTRVMPSSLESERYVLGAAMIDKDALHSMLEILSVEDFYGEAHREIYLAIEGMAKNGKEVDALLVCEELKTRQVLQRIGGRATVLTIATEIPSSQNAEQYAKIVAEKSMLRKLIKTASQIVESGFAENMESEKILDLAEQSIFEIAQGNQSRDYASMESILQENLKIIAEASKNKGGITGVPSGFTDLDAKTAGFQKSNLIVVAARPAMGKTAFALNIAENVGKSGKTVLIFSLEMSKNELGQRLISMESHVEMETLKKGTLTTEDWQNMSIGVDVLNKTNIFIDDTPGISVFEMKNKCRRLKMERGLDLVVIDYLQLMNATGKHDSRQQEISMLSRMLKLLAREIDCPVVLLSQLSRAPEQRGDKRPMLSDLRESGAIEQDADIVIFLYRDDYYNEDSEEKGVTEVIIGKHRSGPTGVVKLAWIGKCTRFVNMDNR